METYVKLRLIREENKLIQAQVAAVLGVVRSTYCGYEIGRRQISPEQLRTLAKFYRLPINTFFDIDEKTVNDSEHYDEQTVYLSSLSKDERDLIVKYRTLNDTEKAEVISSVNQMNDNGEK
ncbi:MAG: helix-turn-helix transcriptional regulator [Oscillospiraceae bacterium]|nr:helix-turn-helix transcriptional regulator [Oscillospiraceae bacterium]